MRNLCKYRKIGKPPINAFALIEHIFSADASSPITDYSKDQMLSNTGILMQIQSNESKFELFAGLAPNQN